MVISTASLRISDKEFQDVVLTPGPDPLKGLYVQKTPFQAIFAGFGKAVQIRF
jgi:hypothetical protein